VHEADLPAFARCATGRRRLARIRLTAAFAGWRQLAVDVGGARREAEQRGAAHAAALLSDCFQGWAAFAAQRADRQAGLVQMVERRAALLSARVLLGWRACADHQRRRRAQLQRATRKLSGVCMRHALSAWRQRVAWRKGEEVRLAAARRRLARRSAAAALAAAFRGWRGHAATLAAARATVEAKAAAERGVLLRHTLASWRNCTAAAAAQRGHVLRVCVARQCCALQSRALVAWQLFAQVGAGALLLPGRLLAAVGGSCFT
jgi:hypothetical protein